MNATLRRLTRLPFPWRVAIATGIAFVAGLLLFTALMVGDRTPSLPEDTLALPARDPSQSPEVPALPAPQPAQPLSAPATPAGSGDASLAPGLYGPAPDDALPAADAPFPTVDVPAFDSPAPEQPATDAAGPERAPVATHMPPPGYPRSAMRRGETGQVLVSAQVGVDGLPHTVQVLRSSGYPALDRAAVRAVERWRFEPALRAGRPVPGDVQVPVDFMRDGG
ncbi:energy transducer TonB [Luteimonas abyssi]|uniref:energy transducer TonB n=1 Tax=Luteimonas abyssi TaxID=1247514 RepID=UPI000737D3E3|nr:energy transducer TonB [Luteimonas abyssi]